MMFGWLQGWLVDWFIDSLIGWLIDGWMDWLIHSFIDSLKLLWLDSIWFYFDLSWPELIWWCWFKEGTNWRKHFAWRKEDMNDNGWNEMTWHEMTWHEMKWNEMTWNEMNAWMHEWKNTLNLSHGMIRSCNNDWVKPTHSLSLILLHPQERR